MPKLDRFLELHCWKINPDAMAASFYCWMRKTVTLLEREKERKSGVCAEYCNYFFRLTRR